MEGNDEEWGTKKEDNDEESDTKRGEGLRRGRMMSRWRVSKMESLKNIRRTSLMMGVRSHGQIWLPMMRNWRTTTKSSRWWGSRRKKYKITS